MEDWAVGYLKLAGAAAVSVPLFFMLALFSVRAYYLVVTEAETLAGRIEDQRERRARAKKLAAERQRQADAAEILVRP